MADITVDAWLYGNLARYGGQPGTASHANLQVRLPVGSTLSDQALSRNICFSPISSGSEVFFKK